MDILLLTVPDQHSYQDPAVERNPRRVQAWVNELPLLNLAVAVPMLLEALENCNAQRMPAKERIALLEQYRKPVEAIFISFDRRRLEQDIPNTTAKDRLKEQLALLFNTLAEGYKLVLLEGHRQGRRLDKDPLLLMAAYRALEQIILGILHAFRLYGPLPPFAYMELHQIYALAEAQGVADTPLHKHDQDKLRTIGALYKRLMLIAIGDPYHLGEGEAFKLFQALEPIAPLCVIGTQLPETGPEQEGRFLIDLHGDSPPQACERDGFAEEPRVLDVRGVAAALPGYSRSEHLPRLRRLLPKLSVTQRRSLNRRPVNREIAIAIGITAVHALLLGRGKSERWQVVNESAHGYLLRNNGLESLLCVGEVLAIRDPRDGDRPMLAVTRWMRQGKGGHVETGIEVIPGEPSAVNVEIDGKEQAIPGLTLPAAPALGLPASLIVLKGRIYSRDKVTLISRTGGLKLRLAMQAGEALMTTEAIERIALHSHAQ